MSTKVLLIGLDSMEGSLVKQWSAEGLLPNLNALMRRCEWADTTNPEGFSGGMSVWPSFYTGCSPQVHGRYAFRKFIPGTYTSRPTSPEELLVAPFWETFSDKGKRVAILDMPSGYPAKDLNGLQVSYWGTHDIEGEFHTSPGHYAKTFKDSYGNEPVGQCDNDGQGPRELSNFKNTLLQRIDTRLSFSVDILNQEDWDLFSTVFSEPHCVGHQAWHLPETVLAIYSAIDIAIGELLKCVDEDCKIMVYSSQGMGPNNSAEHLINTILLQRDSNTSSSGQGKMGGKLYHALYYLRSKIPTAAHKYFGPIKEKLRNHLLASDWAARDVFPISPSSNGVSCIRFNLIGREPAGRIHPGEDFQRYFDDLKHDLELLIEPNTGQPLVSRILQTSEHYTGSACESFPDMLIEWNNAHPINAAYSEKIGLVEGKNPGRRSGDHINRGFALVSISPSKELNISAASEVRAIDLVPTIANWLGIEDIEFSGSAIERWR